MNELVPSVIFDDGNCLFSTVSFIYTGSIDYNHTISENFIKDSIIVDELNQIFLKVIQIHSHLHFVALKNIQ